MKLLHGHYKVMSVNKDIERVSLMINGMIKDTLEYKEYIKNKCLLDENEKLSSLRVNLEKLKHLMCKCDDKSIRDEYSSARSEYDSSALVVNFKISEDKLNRLIRGIIEDISADL